MARVYLDTSFVSACVTTRDDAASVYRRETSQEWMQTQAGLHDLHISIEVLNELDRPSYPQRDAALSLVSKLPIVAVDRTVLGLAAIFIRERVMPGPVEGDAIHVAACCVHRIEYLLSWNVRHLANPNKLVHLQTVAVRAGFAPPRILTPDLLWEER